MAQYPIRHNCGHTHTYHLYGPGQKRKQKERWLAEQPCRDCLRRIDQERAAAHAEKHNLPPLDGSEKQVDWAMRIRHDTFVALDRVIVGMDRAEAVPIPEPYAFFEGETITLGDVLATLAAETRAKWWIDNAKQVDDLGKVPLYTSATFASEVLRAAAFGDRKPTDTELVESGELPNMLRVLLP